MQAVKASGFKENQVELVEHIPQKVVPGAVASAQDINSAVTPMKRGLNRASHKTPNRFGIS